MWVHVCHLSEKTLSKREAWVAALRSFIPRYALSVGEAVVVMINPWKICYNTIEKLFLQQAADTRDSRNSFRNSRQVLLTREMSKRSHSACSCGFHDTSCVCQARPPGWGAPRGRAGTQPKLAESKSIFLQMVSDGRSKEGSLQT